MADERPFAELILRVRQGDDVAAEILVRRYADAIRREVRFRLRDARVRRLLDSSDVCQMVLGSFFARTALGQFDIESPGQLLNLLLEIARNKITDAVRREHAQKQGGAHDFEPLEGTDGAVRPLPNVGPTPSEEVATRDLVHHLLGRMTAEERQVCQLRMAGLKWEEIAAQLGVGQAGLERGHQRLINRLANEANLDSMTSE